MLHFQVDTKGDQRHFRHEAGPIQFGRRPAGAEGARYVLDDRFVSRDHLRVEEQPNGQIVLENLSQKNRVRLGDGSALEPGERRNLALPVRVALGETVLDINGGEGYSGVGVEYQTIAEPVKSAGLLKGVRDARLPADGPPSAAVLARWFETVIAVQRAAASSPAFYQQTAQALVELVGLDRGLVLLRDGVTWQVAARHARADAAGREFSHTVLQHVLSEGRTFFQPVASLPQTSESIQGVEAVVASPVFDPAGRVAGALYGSRTRLARSATPGIGTLEAQLVQLLASAVGAGLARLEQETTAARLRVQFEQFFSARVARALERSPQLLDGQEREVTVLLCDLRGFSGVAERLRPEETCRLLSGVMDRLVSRIHEFDGGVVDYTGDGFLAMWNAPADQPEHAELACRAALAMLAELPKLREGAWPPDSPLSLGIGVNTGPALVGNVGSRHRLKYGPLGHTVNLASRVENATKRLGVPALITRSTHDQLGGQFATRRLGRARVVGMGAVVELFELHGETASTDWLLGRDAYEKALESFEAGRWAEACKVLKPFRDEAAGEYDLPSLDLLVRAAEYVKSPPRSFDPVIELGGK